LEEEAVGLTLGELALTDAMDLPEYQLNFDDYFSQVTAVWVSFISLPWLLQLIAGLTAETRFQS
jgi:hypothetical protein